MKKQTKGAGPKPAPAGNPALFLRLPENVGAALAKDAKKTSTTIQAVALGIITEHYGIEVAAPQRGRPKTEVSE